MQALQRLTAILDIVAAHGPIAPAEIGLRMDVPFSTVARLTRQLFDEGMVSRVPDSGKYVIGWRIFDLASAGQGSVDLATLAVPVMTRLRTLTGETVSLHVLRGDQRLCIAEVQSTQELRRVVAPGTIQGLAGTTGGEVLLSGMTDAEIADYAQRTGIRGEERTKLVERIAEIRAIGFAVITRTDMGIVALSVPVARAGRVRATLSVSGPLSRFSGSVAAGFADAAKLAADDIARIA
ncbi:MAG: transcriptional regulator, IclR family [Subtercola sp.]|nr:transcriptional regulator, IclR family [Subtercola sp.]